MSSTHSALIPLKFKKRPRILNVVSNKIVDKIPENIFSVDDFPPATKNTCTNDKKQNTICFGIYV